ncbi:MAG: hypothetical protein IPN80_05290 [Flavobacterium sp.]|nr:hypothetical protein [Flavobacterium sp.]
MPNSLKLFITILLLFVTISQAQNKSKEGRSEKKPDWILMMDDPNANFFETVKAFRNYYKDRPLPKEPNEVEGEDDFEKQVGLEEASGKKKSKRELEREARKSGPNDIIYSAITCVSGWFYSIQPWVQTGGSIINKEEQQAIIDRQQEELKAVENSNGKK